MVRDDLPLGALATRLARITQASVVVSDGLYRVLACDRSVAAETLRELSLAPWPTLQAALRQAGLTRARQQLELEDGGTVLVCPVSVGSESLGFIVLDCRHRRPDAVDGAAADSAALVAAAHFLRERALEEGEIRRRGALLERLLRGEAPSPAEAMLQPPLRLTVGALRPPPEGQQEHNARVLRTFLALTQEALATGGVPLTVTLREGRVVAVQSLAGTRRDAERVRLRLEEAAERLSRLAPGWQAVYALEDDVPELADLAAAHDEARLAIEVRERLGRREPVFTVRSLGAYRLILRSASGAEVVELCRRVLRAAVEHDLHRRGMLLDTFRTYLEAGAVKATAIRLRVHPHTVEYRLRRLQELTGLDLRRPEDRLTLELALRVLDLATIGKEPSKTGMALFIEP